MKTLIALLMFVISFAVNTVSAQDVIVLKSGDKIKSKVVEITPTEIKYKKFDNLEGPTIVILKSDASIIKYANGTEDVMPSNNSPASTKSENTGAVNPVPMNSGGVSLYVMPLGFLEFGPVFGAEFALVPNLSVGFHARIESLGLLSYVITENGDGYEPNTINGMGIGADVNFYPQTVRKGFYFGGLLEYLWGTATYNQGDVDEYRNTTSFLAAAFDGGYKFSLSRSFYLRTGGTLGAAFPLDEQPTVHPNAPYNTSNYNQSNVTVFGMIDLAIGVTF
jgi:hypothetical protein